MDQPHALLTGGAGMLAHDLQPALLAAGWRVSTLPRLQLDITDPRSVTDALESTRPTAVINTAAWTDVDGAEVHRARAEQVNAVGPEVVARGCASRGLPMVHLSTDYVFGGRGSGSRDHPRRPLREDDPPRPANSYGRSKLDGERRIRDTLRYDHLIVRTAWLYGAAGPSFPRSILEQAAAGEALSVADDQIGCPTWSADLADAIVALLAVGARGTVHFCAADSCSWFELAGAVCEGARARGGALTVPSIRPAASRVGPGLALRPRWSVLDTGRYAELSGRPPPPWRDALDRFLDRHLDDLLPPRANS